MLLTLAALLPLLVGAQSGLIKKDMVVGKGAPARAGDLLVVDYKGSLANGKVFDQSFGMAPFSFTLGKGEVIKGWDLGIAGMRVGCRRMLTIPSSLGYGRAGSPPDIPADATLKFEVRLYHIWPRGSSPRVIVKDVKVGKGRAAKQGDSVEVHYKGTFPNGVKFDSSYDRKQPLPVTIGAGGVIPGFDKGLIGMKVGGRRKVTIHPQLAYGERGAGGVIPPNATIVFELELVKIK